jgi:hypothetical protein
MTRKPHDTAHINLRIRESLRAKLAREAEKNRVSLNTEIRTRLENSFEKAAIRDLAAVAADMKELYAFGGHLWRRLTLEERLAGALAAGDFEKAKPLASAWLEQRREP